jgi:hypothetical protein
MDSLIDALIRLVIVDSMHMLTRRAHLDHPDNRDVRCLLILVRVIYNCCKC